MCLVFGENVIVFLTYFSEGAHGFIFTAARVDLRGKVSLTKDCSWMGLWALGSLIYRDSSLPVSSWS